MSLGVDDARGAVLTASNSMLKILFSGSWLGCHLVAVQEAIMPFLMEGHLQWCGVYVLR